MTRWPEAFAVPKIDAPTISNLLVKEMLARHGAPRTLPLDRGANFLLTQFRLVCDLLSTQKVNTTAFYPQTDGMVECFNHILCQSISMYVSRNQKDWDLNIPSIFFGYRVSPHDATGESTFYLLNRRKARLPMDVSLFPSRNETSSLHYHRARIVQGIEEARKLLLRIFNALSEP